MAYHILSMQHNQQTDINNSSKSPAFCAYITSHTELFLFLLSLQMCKTCSGSFSLFTVAMLLDRTISLLSRALLSMICK